MVNLGEPRFWACSPPLTDCPDWFYEAVVNMVNLILPGYIRSDCDTASSTVMCVFSIEAWEQAPEVHHVHRAAVRSFM
jgi:hypothetical protein